ncbi:uncharacterized protein LOC141640808 [Silene latifolia]|uniref:uncharacterized protein LOC141640808 n=1 Tax=Silene latifolia TaxID=37657 RepID=UPI003D78344B
MCRIPCDEDIKTIIFAIPDEKSPRPDGYTSKFYKSTWHILKKDICTVIHDFFQSGKLLHSLPDVINAAQSAFIQGRTILRDILITQDLVRLYTRKCVSPRCLIKVDLRKAYDSIEWKSVHQMLELIERVMEHPGFSYHPLCMQLKMTHLMFADDLLLFCKGDIKSVTILMEAFKVFTATTGLTISSEKSDIYMNGVVSDEAKAILDVTGFKRGVLPFKYLWVCISHKKLSKIDCNILVDKMLARFRGWNKRKLSYSARLVLVKAVLVTIYTY